MARASATSGRTVLTLPVPVLNLYLLAVAATLAVSWLPTREQYWIGGALLALGALGAVGFAFYRSAFPARRDRLAFSIGAAAALVLGFVSFMLLPADGVRQSDIPPRVGRRARRRTVWVLVAYDRRRSAHFAGASGSRSW